MYEYNINDIISEEDDLPSLQIHTKQFLGCFPYTAKFHIMTPSFPKMADIVGIKCKYEAIISTPQFLAYLCKLTLRTHDPRFQGVEIMAS